VLADGSLASYFRGRVEPFYLGEGHPEQWKYLRESGTQRVGGGRLWMTGFLIVRRTGPPMAVRRGTLMVPDCAVITCLGGLLAAGKDRPARQAERGLLPPALRSAHLRPTVGPSRSAFEKAGYGS
jgi:hypothetical protein